MTGYVTVMAASGARPYQLIKELSFALLRQLCCPLDHYIVLKLAE